MNLTQKIYNWLSGIKTPTWLKTLLSQIQDLIIAAAMSIGKEYISQLEAKILDTAQNSNYTSEKKFMVVFKWAKDNIPDIKDSVLNMLIEILVNKLKQTNFTRVS